MTEIEKPTDEYLKALNQARQIITQSQEQFLRTANRISMEVRLNRNDVEVDYVLPETKRPIGVAELELFKSLPDNLIGKLPDPKELENEILHSLEQLRDPKNDKNS